MTERLYLLFNEGWLYFVVFSCFESPVLLKDDGTIYNKFPVSCYAN